MSSTVRNIPDNEGQTGTLSVSVDPARNEPAPAVSRIADLVEKLSHPDIASSSMDLGHLLGGDAHLHDVFAAFQAAINQHAIVAITDRRGRIVFANEKFCTISGYPLSELLGNSHRLVNSGYHPSAFFTDMWATISSAEKWHGEICNRSRSGSIYWVDTTIVPILDKHGTIYAYVSIRYDVTWRKEAEAELQAEVQKRRQAEMLLREVIETIPDGIAAFDPDDRLALYNQAYLNIYRLSQDAIKLGASFETIIRRGLEAGQYALAKPGPEAQEAWFAARYKSHLDPGKVSVQELSDGHWLLINERRSSSGYTIGSRTDITELKRSEALAKFNAEHDPLTRLFNRLVLDRRLEQAIETSRRTGAEGALVVIDLDGFKAVNDSMGHGAGDALLIAVAERMTQAIRKSDTAIRLGGDEFALIIPRLRRKDATAFARRLGKAITQPVLHQRQRIRPQLSMGMAFFPRDGTTVETLLRKADLALYQAKAEGHGATCIYSKALHAREVRKEKLTAALAAAIAADRIDIALQPQFRLTDRAHTGFEVLARWTSAGQTVSPAEFIPIAEERGLIIDLGLRVIEKTLSAVRHMKDCGLDVGRVALNVAAAQLRTADFASKMLSMVTAHGLRAEDIELELTENILLDREQGCITDCLARLREMGFSLALDDFGTGYASLVHLSHFPISKVKIDRSFVRDMLDKPDVQTIVRAMVGLAVNLDLDVVAEGIETDAQLAKLIEMECRIGQGYLQAPPLSVDGAVDFLKTR